MGQAKSQKAKVGEAALIQRLNSLEKETQALKTNVADLKRQNQIINEKNKELEDSIGDYEPFKYWSYILTLLGISSIGGLAVLYFKIIPGKVNGQVDAIITKLLTDRRDDFLGLLKEYDFEKSVKSKHQIVLLSHRDGDDSYHFKMLDKNGFRVTPFTKLEHLTDAQFAEDDILVINNDGYHWKPEEVTAFINGLPNFCFYFGSGRIDIEGEGQNRFTAANFRTQFIGNLMNSLKYAHPLN
jgi:hypothetical protein